MATETARATESVLSQLGRAHGTDKYPWYTEFYDCLLGDREVRIMLEIGILNGASLQMWADYWPQATIYGMDNDPRKVNAIQARPLVDRPFQLLQGDQHSPRDLEEVANYGPFDFILDDGSHRPEDQVLTALALVPKLSKGGVYVIEDVNPPISDVVDKLPFPNQYVECRIPGSSKVGRCVVIPSLP